MTSLVRKACLGIACFAVVGAADAQNATLLTGQAPSTWPSSAQTPSLGYVKSLSATDAVTLKQALDAAQAGDVEHAKALQTNLSDTAARRLVLWAMIDSAPDRLSFFELDQARKDLWGWPRAAKRQAAAERQFENQAMAPKAVIEWFKGADPATPEGAMALAAAYRASGQTDQAKALIVHFWRDKVFEAEPQRAMLSRFGDLLTPQDHIRRADMLLYGQQGPAARDMVAVLPSDQQLVARARIAYREGAHAAISQLPSNLQSDPGLAFEQARAMVRLKSAGSAVYLIPQLGSPPTSDETGSAIWAVRKALVCAALAARDYRAAYDAAANTGLQPGVDYAEAEFYAGWIALTKLKNPALADQHFANIQQVGSSPITQSRALYWRGRAAEAGGDQIGSKDFYSQASLFPTTFYGQLAAERAGLGEFAIGHDPVITAADRSRFEGRETVQAARMLAEAGERDLFRSFVLSIDDTLPSGEEYALLVDLARSYGDQDLSMRVVRAAAQHAYILPDRGYPMLAAPTRDAGSPELALVYGIVRQESGFDPKVRSGPGARGMMQLMPATAQHTARKLGVGYAAGMLDDPDYNMRLGSAYLGDMVNSFGGSYVMAAASYNAGPNHMPDWTAICGDPRTASGDPVDFIECIPISETRNYVMRVLEAMQVYRARLNGGHAALTLSRDLKRGVYVPGATPLIAQSNAAPLTADPLTPPAQN